MKCDNCHKGFPELRGLGLCHLCYRMFMWPYSYPGGIKYDFVHQFVQANTRVLDCELCGQPAETIHYLECCTGQFIECGCNGQPLETICCYRCHDDMMAGEAMM